MEKIGFKNFRKFKKLESVDLGKITFLVGRNNSGKSTLVKAILLIVDYLKHKNLVDFRFDGLLHNDSAFTFERLMNVEADTDFIDFDFIIDNYYNCSIRIVKGFESNNAKVINFNLKIPSKGININVESTGSKLLTISRIKDNKIINDNFLIDRHEEIDNLKKQLSVIDKNKEFKEFININTNILKYEKIIKNYYYINSNESDYSYTINLDSKEYNTHFISELVAELMYLGKKIKNEKSDDEQDLRGVLNDRALIEKEVKGFEDAINGIGIKYISADSHKQSTLFSINDNKNDLAQTIHKYHQLKIKKNSKIGIFVKKYMTLFEVGVDYKITCYENEVYLFQIYNRKGDHPINLVDKGMGSLQAMRVILHLALELAELEKNNLKKSKTTFIIEEPELNLHPALQSQLTDLFYEVYENYGVRFIIETHSEYLIRKSQIVMKDIGFKNIESVMKTFYFDEDKGPYEMIYTESGKFDRNFGIGFYDEAAKHAMDIIKADREINKKKFKQ